MMPKYWSLSGWTLTLMEKYCETRLCWTKTVGRSWNGQSFSVTADICPSCYFRAYDHSRAVCPSSLWRLRPSHLFLPSCHHLFRQATDWAVHSWYDSRSWGRQTCHYYNKVSTLCPNSVAMTTPIHPTHTAAHTSGQHISGGPVWMGLVQPVGLPWATSSPPLCRPRIWNTKISTLCNV